MAGQDKKRWFSFLSRRTPVEGASLQGSAEVPVVKVSAAPGMQAPLSGPAPVGIEWDVGHTILDDFVVERVLGEGGMGKVYLVGSRTTGLRFAVKRMKRLKEEDCRNFLAELQTWIDLPDHPNLVPCRFFRTVADEVLIFAEYVEGGSLRHWIDSRRLYDGGERKALERILDVAIQFAWGLHCVHELGLVHQDVKPGNVMVAGDAGVSIQGMKARVTDYGLARARAAAGDRSVLGSGGSILISSGGYTPAYCSPEQPRRKRVTRKTDIWSWGVSVLEMFAGGVIWPSGTEAARALEGYLQRRPGDGEIPRMPEALAEVLRGCFREDTGERWEDLATVVRKLQGIYRQTSGVSYDRALPPVESRATPQTGIGERRTWENASWPDPRQWLKAALRAEGRDPGEAEQIVVQHSRSRRGQLVADLAVYAEARRIYERLVYAGRKELETDLANLCIDAANVHRTADDAPGALALFDRVIEIRERLVNVEGRRELAPHLASIYMMKAVAVTDLGDNQGAIALYDRAIALYERLVNMEGRRKLSGNLAVTCMNKATVMLYLGDNRAAVALCDRAIEIYERLMNVEGWRALIDDYDLPQTLMNKALAVSALGDNQGAIALYDRAIAVYERLVNVEGRRELARELARSYLNKGVAVKDGLGDNQGAIALYDRGIEIYERVVNVEGRRELASDLAVAYQNKAIAVEALGDKRAAVALYDRAIEVYERLVHMEGRAELAGDFAKVKARRGVALVGLGETARGRREALEAMAVLRAEVARTGRVDLKSALERTAKQINVGP